MKCGDRQNVAVILRARGTGSTDSKDGKEGGG